MISDAFGSNRIPFRKVPFVELRSVIKNRFPCMIILESATSCCKINYIFVSPVVSQNQLAIFSPHPLQNRKSHDITWPEEPIFIENDAKLLLQRLPDDIKNVHYHDDETHIRLLLEKYGLVPKRGISFAAATVLGLILTVSHKEQIGGLYPQVLETLVYGACRELFK